jgi:light-regulated signal transduction histidine kinase (bacteriophytochrome)
VLNNLLGNAWKYSGKVENSEISFGKVELEGITTLFIADNGAGFDMEKAEKLFSPFIRLHSNNEFQGTGVGLSTVKRIIEKHNGSIWAESEKGKGAIFYFTINT